MEPGEAFERLAMATLAGAQVESEAWAKVAGRFAAARALMSPLEWSAGHAQARSWASPSGGGEPYRVAVWIDKGERLEPFREPEGEDPELREYWSGRGWRAVGGCSCPFSGSTRMGVCKHLGALAQWAGEAAASLLSAKEIELHLDSGRVLGDDAGVQGEGSARPSKPRL